MNSFTLSNLNAFNLWWGLGQVRSWIEPLLQCYIYKCWGLVHWEDPEGSGREGGGRGDRDGEYM